MRRGGILILSLCWTFLLPRAPILTKKYQLLTIFTVCIFFYWQDILYTALVVLAFLFTFCGNAESKPTISTLQDQPNSKVTKESIESHDTNQETAGMMAHSAGYKDDAVIQSTEHGRLKRETLTLPNPCVAGYKLKLIDRERVVLTVSCAQGCKEIKRVFFLPDREDPLTFVVDCKK